MSTRYLAMVFAHALVEQFPNNCGNTKIFMSKRFNPNNQIEVSEYCCNFFRLL